MLRETAQRHGNVSFLRAYITTDGTAERLTMIVLLIRRDVRMQKFVVGGGI